MNKCKEKPTCLGYHWEKEKNPDTGDFFTHHEYGICILKEFLDQTEEIEQRTSEFEEHKSSLLDYQNNETEFNLNLSLAFEENFVNNLSGYISTKIFDCVNEIRFFI